MVMHKLSLLQLAGCLQLALAAHRLAAGSPAEASSSPPGSLQQHQSSETSAPNDTSRQVRSVCLWDCSSARQKQQQQHHHRQKQNTTRLLLFTRASGEGGGAGGAEFNGEETVEGEPAGSAELAATSFTKFSPANELRESGFQPHHHTILMIHGFRGSGISRQPWALETKELALARGRPRANLLFADWSHHARVLSYLHAMEHIGEVAEDVLSVLENLQAAFPGFRMESMEIIGHSLGAHIAGLLGQMMRGRLHKITALGFLLNSARSHLKLSRDDARYVIAYHTDTKYFGTNMNLAHRDVYFGDGSNQPACARDHFGAQFLPSTCNHRLSTRYSSTYMGRCLMVAYLCGSHSEFASGACGFCERDSTHCVLVGHKWQYQQQLADQLEEEARRDAQLVAADFRADRSGVEWAEDPQSRYFIEMQAEKPYCAFTYQVVAVFPESLSRRLAHLKHLEVVLVAAAAAANNESSGGPPVEEISASAPTQDHLEDQQAAHLLVRVRLTNQRHLNRARVFADSRGRTATVEGEHVFTGLALVRTSSNSSHADPLKFNEALLGPLAAQAGTSQEADEEPTGGKVFVNYMSHIGFEERAAHSGPLRLKWISGRREARQ